MPHSGDHRDKPGSDRISGPSGEIYIEYKQVGQAMKVIAVDSATGTEVTIMGPASAAQTDLQRIAVRKLQAQLEKASDEAPTEPADDTGEDSSSGSKGWIA